MQTLFACACWTNLTDGASKSIQWFLQHRNHFIFSAIGLGQSVWRKTWFWSGKIMFAELESGDCWELLGFLPFLRCLLLLGNLPGKKLIFGSRKSFLWNWTAICWGFSLFALSTAARQTAAKKWFWGQENHFSRKRPRRVVLLRKSTVIKDCWSDGCLEKMSSKTAKVPECVLLCFCGGLVVLLCLCFCDGVFVLVLLCLCFCGGVVVFVFLWWCGCVFVVVFWFFLWLCFWGGVVVFLWLCFCVLLVVWLCFAVVWWCFCGVFCVSCGCVFVVVLLWREALAKRVVDRCWRVLWKSVVEKCWRRD